MKAVWWMLGIGAVCGAAIGGAVIVRRLRRGTVSPTSTATLNPSFVVGGPGAALSWQTGAGVTSPSITRVLGWRPSLLNATHASVLTPQGTVELRPIAGNPTLERLLASARTPAMPSIMDLWRGR